MNLGPSLSLSPFPLSPHKSHPLQSYVHSADKFLKRNYAYFRIPENSPGLHDKVLAAAADAAVSFSQSQKKTQVTNITLLVFFSIC